MVVVYMADLSDGPEDVVAYYRKIREGYDCVFGSRFIKGSKVVHYPKLKLVANRIVNRCIQVMFWTRFNDLTNAFKAYRTDVIRDCGPYHASHFNLTLEMSLGARRPTTTLPRSRPRGPGGPGAAPISGSPRWAGAT